MTGAGRLYVPLAALAVAAMAGRAGWIDWPAAILFLLEGLATILGLAALLGLLLVIPSVGLTFLVLKVADRLPPAAR